MSGDSADRPIVCRRIIFHGRVQGVGFRFTTASVARRFGVKGYVRNCPDGTVELVCEGSRQTVENFSKAIAAEFEGNIDRQEVEELAPEHLSGFEIRR